MVTVGFHRQILYLEPQKLTQILGIYHSMKNCGLNFGKFLLMNETNFSRIAGK